jgi:voltage-gated sodium channel
VTVSTREKTKASRHRLATWIEQPRIQNSIIFLIVVNAVVMGLETDSAVMLQWGALLTRIDIAILVVFVVEITLRIVSHGWQFFRDPWSVFDFVVVAIALIPGSGPFAVLRALRVLRVLRLLTMVPSMRRVVGGLLEAIPGLVSVIAIIGIIFYVASVIATQLFGERFPDWFGHLGESAYTLFQIMTLESWSMGIVRPVMEVYPHAWLFFVPFILIATFTMLNLFIAIIVNAMQVHSAVQQEKTVTAVEAVTREVDQHVHEHLLRIETELQALRERLARSPNIQGSDDSQTVIVNEQSNRSEG